MDMLETTIQSSAPVWEVGKMAVLFFLGLYTFFSLIVVRQVQIMNRTLDVGYESLIFFVAFAHLFFSIGTLIFAIMIL